MGGMRAGMEWVTAWLLMFNVRSVGEEDEVKEDDVDRSGLAVKTENAEPTAWPGIAG
jgi:hypothetical protein